MRINAKLASRFWLGIVGNLLPTPVLFVLLLFASRALGQSAPVSPDQPWHASDERKIEAVAKNLRDSRFNVDPGKTYSLAELVNLAEAHNPETRLAWERARSQAAAFGVARSELDPRLAAAALSQTGRSEVLFGNRFDGRWSKIFKWNSTSTTASLISAPVLAESTLRARGGPGSKLRIQRYTSHRHLPGRAGLLPLVEFDGTRGVAGGRRLSSASLTDPPILAPLTLGRGTEKHSSPIASSSPRPFPSLSSASFVTAARSPQQKFRNRWRGLDSSLLTRLAADTKIGPNRPPKGGVHVSPPLAPTPSTSPSFALPAAQK